MGFIGHNYTRFGFIKSCEFCEYLNDYQHFQADTPRLRCPICAFISQVSLSLYAVLSLFQLRINFPAWAGRALSL
jgi:hypothetical protein